MGQIDLFVNQLRKVRRKNNRKDKSGYKRNQYDTRHFREKLTYDISDGGSGSLADTDFLHARLALNEKQIDEIADGKEQDEQGQPRQEPYKAHVVLLAEPIIIRFGMQVDIVQFFGYSVGFCIEIFAERFEDGSIFFFDSVSCSGEGRIGFNQVICLKLQSLHPFQGA